MKIKKTNPMRELETLNIDYKPHGYGNDEEVKSGEEVAEILDVSEDIVFKTLVAHSGRDNYVFIIPSSEELDLKKAAKVAGEKKIEMLHVKDLFKETGYVRGGCSPIGMKKDFPKFIDESGKDKDSIFISAGKVGLQIEINPNDLVENFDIKWGDLT